MIGCSRFEDTTSVGSSVIDGIDSSTLNFSKNILPFGLDTNIVSAKSSIPDKDDTLFGVHTGSAFPVGGKNGEIATAYFEFKTSFENWEKVGGVDSLADLTTIESTELIFNKADSTNVDYSYNQIIDIINVEDSAYKYNRNRTNVDKILNTTNYYRMPLDTADLKQEFYDSILCKQILESCTMQHSRYAKMSADSQAIFKDTIFKPKTFRFVLLSKNNDINKYASLKSSASLKVHMKVGESKKVGSKAPNVTTIHARHDTSYISKDTIFIKAPIDTLPISFDTLYNQIKKIGEILHDTTYKPVDSTAVDTSTTVIPFDTITYKHKFRVKNGENTWVIDSNTTFIDTLVKDSVITHFYKKKTRKTVMIVSVDTTRINPDSLRVINRKLTLKVDSLFDSPAVIALSDTIKRIITSVDTIVMKADSFNIPLSHSNFAMYEKSDTLANRQNIPMSAFGPQRTAVFALNVDSLWKKLAEPATASHPAFNKILSAGVAITGTYAPMFQANTTDLSDTTIIVRWFISENKYDNGIEIYKKDKTLGRNDEVKPGKEVVLPVEKNLQEILSRSATTPSTVYLYLEILSNKQVIWSKPSLLTVLTTSK
jgi:hypothetical protein